MKGKHRALVDRYSETASREDIKAWTDMMEAWHLDHRKPNPFAEIEEGTLHVTTGTGGDDDKPTFISGLTGSDPCHVGGRRIERSQTREPLPPPGDGCSLRETGA